MRATFGLLNRDAVLEAAHEVYTVLYLRAEDDHAEAWDHAAEILLRHSDRTALDPCPFLADGVEWNELARGALEGRSAGFPK